VVQEISVVNYPTEPWLTRSTFGGRKTGSDGNLVIWKTEVFNPRLTSDFWRLGLVDPRATVLDNASSGWLVAIGPGAGFGNNSCTRSSIVGHSSLFRPNDVDHVQGSTTFMLIQSPGQRNTRRLSDSPLNVTPLAPTRTNFQQLDVLDAVGHDLDPIVNGDVSYGLSIMRQQQPRFYELWTPNSTIIPGSFTTDYLAANNNSGWVAAIGCRSGIMRHARTAGGKKQHGSFARRHDR